MQLKEKQDKDVHNLNRIITDLEVFSNFSCNHFV